MILFMILLVSEKLLLLVNLLFMKDWSWLVSDVFMMCLLFFEEFMIFWCCKFYNKKVNRENKFLFWGYFGCGF